MSRTAYPWYRAYLETIPWADSYDVTTRLLNARQARLGVELGIAGGFHCEQILLRCPSVSVIGVDTLGGWTADDASQQAMLALLAPYPARFSFVNERTDVASLRMPDGIFDWLYVDASHDYNNVLQDLTLWAPKLKWPGGLLMGHDYCKKHEGVMQAVDEFLEHHKLTLSGVEATVWWVDL